jgi:hypothetical protein
MIHPSLAAADLAVEIQDKVALENRHQRRSIARAINDAISQAATVNAPAFELNGKAPDRASLSG